MDFGNFDRPPFESRERRPVFPVAAFELLGKRSSQQDFNGHVVFEKDGKPCLAVAVADGHGTIGGYAARHAVTTVLGRIKENGTSLEALEHTFAEIHDSITEQNVFGGTTLTAVILEQGLITIAWAGNSQARVFSADDSSFHTLTLPHEYGAHPGETDRLMGQHAIIVDPRHPYARPKKRGHIGIPGGGHIEVSRALGDPETEPFVLHEPELKTVVATPDERFLVVATDGFWQSIDKRGRRKAVERILAESQDAQEASRRVKSLLDKIMPDDNTTVVIVDLEKDGGR
ncbi:protein serine/threonine phosphatase 2C family protein [Candidatus Uhrbacteria bacterium]|nr:protein serine/threonine phosphatase 2C family protein [Candidatus Uhrbacteria bacterium]